MMPRIGILIKKIRLNTYENQSFRQEAYKLKWNLDFLFIEDFTTRINTNQVDIYYQDALLKEYDFIINRVGSSVSVKDACIIDTIAKKYHVVNNGSCGLFLKNKYQVLLQLQERGIPIIPTTISGSNANLHSIINNMEFPIVFKSNTGSIGKGIYLVDDDKALSNMQDLSQLIAKDYTYILQDFMDDEVGVDVRVIVYFGEVICAMQRSSNDGDFKANYSIHNQAKLIELDDETKNMCQQITKILNCELAGIDLLPTKNGYVVCEVNSAPGFKGMDSVQSFLMANKLLYLGYKHYENKKM